MKIINSATGQTSYTAQPITKSAGTLIFGTDKTFAQIAAETVTIRIERPSATDVYIATNVKLKDLILLNLHAENSGLLVDPAGVLKTLALLELGVEGGVILTDSDKIHITINGCDATKIYDLSVVEDVVGVNTLSHAKYEVKSISSEDSERWIDVSQFVSGVFVIDANVKEIAVRVGSTEKRYSPFEFRCLVQEGIPVLDNGADGLQLPANYYLLDVSGFDQIGIFKTTGSIIPFTFFHYDELTVTTGSQSSVAAPATYASPVRAFTAASSAALKSVAATSAFNSAVKILKR